MFRHLAILLVALATVASATPAAAGDVRWPHRTALPAAQAEPANPPAVLIRAPSAIAAAEKSIHPARCKGETMCVVCVANCADNPTPSVVHAQSRVFTVSTAVASNENDSDGIAENAPDYARPQWAGITCGRRSGCIASGISAPPRPYEANIRITVINRYID